MPGPPTQSAIYDDYEVLLVLLLVSLVSLISFVNCRVILRLLCRLHRDVDAERLSRSLHGQGDTTTVKVDFHNLYLDLVADLADLGRRVDVLLSHLRDVN